MQFLEESELGSGPGWPGFSRAVVREPSTQIHLLQLGPCPWVGGRGSDLNLYFWYVIFSCYGNDLYHVLISRNCHISTLKLIDMAV